MIARRLPLFAIGSLVVLVAISAIGAAAAANTVPPTNAGTIDQPITLASLAPAGCAGLTLTRLQIGPGGNGGGNALILGTSASETLTGGGGDDCIIAGAGSDVLNGQGGNDVLIGGPGGTDQLNGGGGVDTCYGMGFLNTRSSCETYVP